MEDEAPSFPNEDDDCPIFEDDNEARGAATLEDDHGNSVKRSGAYARNIEYGQAMNIATQFVNVAMNSKRKDELLGLLIKITKAESDGGYTTESLFLFQRLLWFSPQNNLFPGSQRSSTETFHRQPSSNETPGGSACDRTSSN